MNKNNILVRVNNVPVYVTAGTTAMQACEKVGIVIPRFCYHDLLEVAGNCRICLVEVEKSPKPQAACGLPVSNNIGIYTNTPLVKKARESVIEFLLVNHPLDCPICDQGGECDLQNQAIKHGSLDSRFYNLKRGVEDKNLGPIIKTVITRCIHCTRCVRFANEIAGVENLGTSLRGNQTEVGTYVKITFNSEVSANVIDLCPVGALTLKNHTFKTRPWELKTTNSIDLSDSLGSNITIQSKYFRPYKILPRYNQKINLEWLSDKSRFIYEGQTNLRILYPFFNKKSKFHRISSWLDTKEILNKVLRSHDELNFIFGRNLDLETLQEGKKYSRHVGADLCSETPFNIFPTLPAYIQSTFDLDEIDKSDSCLLLGVNPRIEATIANLRLRSHFKKNNFNANLLSLGAPLDLTYKSQSFGLHFIHLYNFVYGRHIHSKTQTKRPILIYGDTLSRRKDAYSGLILAYTYKIVKKIKHWLGCLRLPLGSNSVGKTYLGIAKPKLKNSYENSSKINYYLGLENTKIIKKLKEKVIIETTHVKDIYKNSDYLVPQQSLLEKDGSFINYSGCVQKSLSVLRFGFKALSYFKNFYITSYKSICRDIFQDFKLSFIKSKDNLIESHVSPKLQEIGQILKKGKLYISPFKALLGDIFCTDSSSWASITLIMVSENFRKVYWSFIPIIHWIQVKND